MLKRRIPLSLCRPSSPWIRVLLLPRCPPTSPSPDNELTLTTLRTTIADTNLIPSIPCVVPSLRRLETVFRVPPCLGPPWLKYILLCCNQFHSMEYATRSLIDLVILILNCISNLHGKFVFPFKFGDWCMDWSNLFINTLDNETNMCTNLIEYILSFTRDIKPWAKNIKWKIWEKSPALHIGSCLVYGQLLITS